MEPHFALCFEGRLKDELTSAGTVVHLLGKVRASRPWTVWQARRRLHRLLAREHFDAVISHSCWPHALFAAVVGSRGLPLIFWAHGVHIGRHWLERWARHTKPDLVLANSRFSRSAVPNLFPGVPSEVLYLPVSPPVVADRAQVRREIRTALQTPEDATVILQASRLERWKGHALLLQALDQLQELPDLGNWICWIAGGAQRPQEVAYLEELKATAASRGIANRIRFLGQRPDVPQLLAAADIHCQANTSPEPFGIAFVEALYAGLPVVTTALGGALEIVDDTCGVLVPPGDSHALAAALRRLIRNGSWRRTLGVAGQARARYLCDPLTQLGRLKESLQAIVRKGEKSLVTKSFNPEPAATAFRESHAPSPLAPG